MTDKMTVRPLKQIVNSAIAAKLAFAVSLSTCILAQPVIAAGQEWWFDVEVILFERKLDATNNTENFKQSKLEHTANDFVDLLTPYLKPDLTYLQAGLSYCRASNRLAAKAQYEESLVLPLVMSDTNQSNIPLPQDQQPQAQSVSPSSNRESAENFQYEVVTSDIFENSKDQEQVNLSISEQSDEGKTARQDISSSTTNSNLPRSPIQIDFIEWQVPSEFPCAYAEQIDPSFASMSFKQNTVLDPLSADYITHVPDIINGIQWQQKRNAILLPSSAMSMQELYEKIRKQRDITPLLHINWRQQVKFGRENAQTIRLFAGKNFADQFDANGLPTIDMITEKGEEGSVLTNEVYITEQEQAQVSAEQQALFVRMNDSATDAEDLFTRIDAALADESSINLEQYFAKTEPQTTRTHSKMLSEIWQLDGGISVYLRNVGRVPYLHIDSDLDYRRPIFNPNIAQQTEQNLSSAMSEEGAISVSPMQQSNAEQPNFLQSANFNQLRRVISKQVHYFDHPLFGMIVKINRYRWPKVEDKEVETLSR